MIDNKPFAMFFNASPRRGWNTHKMLEAAKAGAEEAGGDNRYPALLESNTQTLETVFGASETLYSCDTYQFAGDLDAMIAIWNEIVEAGDAFPQEEPLTRETGAEFFAAQTHTGVVADDDGTVLGLYILHPNNVGRCGHIANASYAVRSNCRGRHLGEKLVLDCLAQAKAHGFGILQFNAVVEGNIHARHLYERLGFTQLGTIPRGFRMKDGTFAAICPYFKEIDQ